jgi:branched-chain amino acid transport system ATP-binding protein
LSPSKANRLEARPDGRSNGVVLDVRDISVSYGGVRAVDDVSFKAERGEILGFIGPNGAGKTTLFDAICGFALTAGGRIELEGRDITELAPTQRARLGLGRSFQDARLFSSLTVFETLACAFERHMRSEDPVSTMLWLPWVRNSERKVWRRVDDIIGLMGLGAFRDKFISELSTGSRRVVDLACVIAHEPSVLLLDEPSSGMAQKETEAMGPLLRRVKDETGCTMLLIEHDMPLVTSVSDELIALETGRVVVRGKPRDVTNDSRVVEAYLGTDERVVARSGVVRLNAKRSRSRAKKPAARRKAPAKRKASAKRA